MIVVDASAVLEVLLASSHSMRIADMLFAPGESLHAPHVLDLEVAQVLRRFVFSRDLSAERGEEALEDLLDLPLTRYPHGPLLVRVWELRANVTAYDAAYLALAEALDAPLVTRDARLKSAPGHAARVELV